VATLSRDTRGILAAASSDSSRNNQQQQQQQQQEKGEQRQAPAASSNGSNSGPQRRAAAAGNAYRLAATAGNNVQEVTFEWGLVTFLGVRTTERVSRWLSRSGLFVVNFLTDRYSES
jgi:hypothetical protein